eukprot:m.196182 g.196182  ORF g.196182 m.196182 type:complete len:231 (+) comp14903_c0_seq5:161-853(+)
MPTAAPPPRSPRPPDSSSSRPRFRRSAGRVLHSSTLVPSSHEHTQIVHATDAERRNVVTPTRRGQTTACNDDSVPLEPFRMRIEEQRLPPVASARLVKHAPLPALRSSSAKPRASVQPELAPIALPPCAHVKQSGASRDGTAAGCLAIALRLPNAQRVAIDVCVDWVVEDSVCHALQLNGYPLSLPVLHPVVTTATASSAPLDTTKTFAALGIKPRTLLIVQLPVDGTAT